MPKFPKWEDTIGDLLGLVYRRTGEGPVEDESDDHVVVGTTVKIILTSSKIIWYMLRGL
ncbi:protein of unknown function [Nitrospira japonica]|uniref:Uncharacterized protein n=1 Tax=Nitrospira japonica TaxID=1325564 RepID=A0A1W1I9X3_9BACT|nr:protein of unknown function [Nitrospira japonica]